MPADPRPAAPPRGAAVKGWNVKLLALNREGRHRDGQVAQELWQQIDAHMAKAKRNFAY